MTLSIGDLTVFDLIIKNGTIIDGTGRLRYEDDIGINGDKIESGVSFLDIRSDLKNDPEFSRLRDAYNNGVEYTQRYHRSWAQIEYALANAEYGFFFGESNRGNKKEAKDNVMIVTPNPASDHVDISTGKNPDNYQVELYDLSGKKISKRVDVVQENSTRIMIDHLPAGIYVVKLTNLKTKQVQRKKIVINR